VGREGGGKEALNVIIISVVVAAAAAVVVVVVVVVVRCSRAVLNISALVSLTGIKPRPHYAGGISKRRFHSENASNVFCPHYAGEI